MWNPFRSRSDETSEPISELAQYHVKGKRSARMARLRKEIGEKVPYRVSEYVLVWLFRQDVHHNPRPGYDVQANDLNMDYESCWSSQSEVVAVLSAFPELKRFFDVGEHFIAFHSTVTEEEKANLFNMVREYWHPRTHYQY